MGLGRYCRNDRKNNAAKHGTSGDSPKIGLAFFFFGNGDLEHKGRGIEARVHFASRGGLAVAIMHSVGVDEPVVVHETVNGKIAIRAVERCFSA